MPGQNKDDNTPTPVRNGASESCLHPRGGRLHSQPQEQAPNALALKWRQSARADLLAIVGYIADDNPDAALELKDEIEIRASELVRHPQMYKTGRVPGTREMVVRSNYVVVYAEDASMVFILRVLHAAQQWP